MIQLIAKLTSHKYCKTRHYANGALFESFSTAIKNGIFPLVKVLLPLYVQDVEAQGYSNVEMIRFSPLLISLYSPRLDIFKYCFENSSCNYRNFGDWDKTTEFQTQQGEVDPYLVDNFDTLIKTGAHPTAPFYLLFIAFNQKATPELIRFIFDQTCSHVNYGNLLSQASAQNSCTVVSIGSITVLQLQCRLRCVSRFIHKAHEKFWNVGSKLQLRLL